jgi:hypothetical protein
VEDVELLVDLQELEGAASSPPFLLGLPVVDVLETDGQPPNRAHGKKQRSETGDGEGRGWLRRREAEVAYPLVFGGLSHGDEEPNGTQQKSGAAEAGGGGVSAALIGDDGEEGGTTGEAARVVCLLGV